MSGFEIFLGGGGEAWDQPQNLLLKYGNRHGLIAGATGTGKTVTLQIMAESFSRAGVPVFLADVKGDLAGLSQASDPASPKWKGLAERAASIGETDYQPESFPVVFWDLFGAQGHPIRATVSEMGPLLLSRLMDLNEVQEGVLNIAFRVADDGGLLLLDMKDLRAILQHVAENAAEISANYGQVAAASVGAIQRRLLVLENEGAESFFGEPALDLRHMMMRAPDGRGQVNVLAADKLMQSPRLYAIFLLWLLSELFEVLPEVGDPEKPKFVFFFDEAHLLFNEAPKALLAKIEMVARLIRSKGVGVYFISQNPIDIPDAVLGQLGNRAQHALRAFTPRDARAVKAAADTFRPNPRFDVAQVIGELAVGEALVSTLQQGGIPSMVERTKIRPPRSRMGPISPQERAAVVAASPLHGFYEEAVDRESAFEILRGRAEEPAPAAPGNDSAARGAGDSGYSWEDFKRDRQNGQAYEGQPYGGQTSGGQPYGGSGGGSGGRAYGRSAPAPAPQPKPRAPAQRRTDSVAETIAKSVARTATSQLTRQLVRGVLGGLFRR
ncbi:helicase HerA-like domain-containing protein [Neomegalonema sp.]|uniref:helicase HerA-like domain-containing protein n=1 Tax=Neomegalonema sp. TaxID=2039713 RepID=UPI00262BD6D0|nr:helicase HerA-like domain-containing protein [Neomegalonema sp.]MDD2868192.1 DUF853 family protein [Neomegalonema sp.]